MNHINKPLQVRKYLLIVDMNHRLPRLIASMDGQLPEDYQSASSLGTMAIIGNMLIIHFSPSAEIGAMGGKTDAVGQGCFADCYW
jgi:hypothetical protein